MGSAFQKISSLSSIVSLFAGSDPVKASLVPLTEGGDEIINFERAFQYFPEQITDNKGVNYASKVIPGGSHPLYQFVNGGDRTITLTAIFTSDEDPNPVDVLDALTGGLEFNASSLIGQFSKEKAQKKHVAPVDSAVIWLRSFIYPQYGGSNGVIAPPVCRIYLPNSGIHGASRNGQLIVDSIDCIMTQCDVVYESFYRAGSQRITTVNLSFFETVQVGDNWQFTDGSHLQEIAFQGNDQIGSYPIKQTKKQASLADKKNSVATNLAGVAGAATRLLR